jgi:dolichol kinase
MLYDDMYSHDMDFIIIMRDLWRKSKNLQCHWYVGCVGFFLCVSDCLQMLVLVFGLCFLIFCMFFFGVLVVADDDNLVICIRMCICSLYGG